MDDPNHGHHAGAGIYVGIWAVLLALTAATYVTGQLHVSPPYGVLLALGIASTKALLVVVYFMHIKDHGATNRAYFITALVFVALLAGFIVSDVATRLPSARPFDLATDRALQR